MSCLTRVSVNPFNRKAGTNRKARNRGWYIFSFDQYVVLFANFLIHFFRPFADISRWRPTTDGYTDQQ